MDVSAIITQGSLTMSGPGNAISMNANKGDITMSVVSYTAGVSHGASLLLEDGASYLLLEDGTSTLLLG